MIKIKNIFYMLTYAFQTLQREEYKSVGSEEFENVLDLYSEILILGLRLQKNRGFKKDYILHEESISTLRGKMNITDSIKSMSIIDKEMVCSFDEFTMNYYLNQILKSTLELLLRSDIEIKRKRQINRLLEYFSDVDTIDLRNANWNIRYTRDNRTYYMLISICEFIVKDMIQTQEQGDKMLRDFTEKHLSTLYENFVKEYYKRHYPELNPRGSIIEWQTLEDEKDYLPNMNTDICLRKDNKYLIIDTKYYSKSFQTYYDNKYFRSMNLYQIFAYVKNKKVESPELDVSGMLLYAKTDEEITPNHSYNFSGNEISIKNLDLNQDFSLIKGQLNKIAEDFINN